MSKRDQKENPCNSPNCCGPLGRRTFLKALGAGALSTGIPVMAGPFTRPAPDVKHFVPADKKLAASWLRGLFEKGRSTTFRGKDLGTIGMPVGGVAAGQLYLRGDGTLGVWQIFNRRNFTGYGATNYQYRTVESPIDQGFAVVLEDEGKQTLQELNGKGFPDAEFTGEYPIGTVSYGKKGFPLRVVMEAFSPFIPLNARDSSLPATLFHITLENRSSKTLRAGLAAWLENAICFHSAGEVRGLRRSRLLGSGNRGILLQEALESKVQEKAPVRKDIVLADFEGSDYGGWKITGEAFGSGPARGTLPQQNRVSGYQGKGLVNTYLQGDKSQGTLTSPPFEISRKYLNFLLGGGSHAETCMNLLVEGKVVRSARGKGSEKLDWRSWNLKDFQGKEAQIQIIDRHSGGWGHINVDQIELSDGRKGGLSGPIDRLEDHGTMVLALDGPAHALSKELMEIGRSEVPWAEAGSAYPIEERRKSGFRTAMAPLQPGEKRTYTLVLAWHFPNRKEGNQYANTFPGALEVASYILDNHSRLAGETRKWHRTFYDSTLPHWLLDRIGSTLSNLATGTCLWWKNGRFWAWEGVGCCSGTCTHVWNYAHALGRLFPELERSVREMQDLEEAFHPNGLIGFRGQRNGHYAADGQAGTILKCYREHLMSEDDRFLRRNWPRIKKALEYSMEQDGNADGLIENSQHNTFDINFFGANTFVGSLYLAALRAGEEMAREVGDREFARRARKVFKSGSRLTGERLWNGEYFIQEVDLKKHPRHQYGEGCLSDQLFGQGWAHQVGLGYIYSRDRIRKALQSVWKYNWAPDTTPYNAEYKPERWFVSTGEAGLFTCTWPRSAYLKDGVRYKNEVWTGIEYQVAGHMIWEGMLQEGLAIIRAIHDRYHPSKHNPFNEIECGDHYARALASWGAYVALSGFEHHGPRGHLGFAPRITPESFRAAFTAAGGWGTFSQGRSGKTQEERIAVHWGRLRIKSLAFEVPDGSVPLQVAVTVGEEVIPASFKARDGRISVDLGKGVALEAGNTLVVKIG